MIEYIGIVCFVYLCVVAKPIVWIKRLLHIDENAKYKNKFQYIILELVNCCMCLGFWIGLTYYSIMDFNCSINGTIKNILHASLVSIGSEALYRLMDRI